MTWANTGQIFVIHFPDGKSWAGKTGWADLSRAIGKLKYTSKKTSAANSIYRYLRLYSDTYRIEIVRSNLPINSLNQVYKNFIKTRNSSLGSRSLNLVSKRVKVTVYNTILRATHFIPAPVAGQRIIPQPVTKVGTLLAGRISEEEL